MSRAQHKLHRPSPACRLGIGNSLNSDRQSRTVNRLAKPDRMTTPSGFCCTYVHHGCREVLFTNAPWRSWLPQSTVIWIIHLIQQKDKSKGPEFDPQWGRSPFSFCTCVTSPPLRFTAPVQNSWWLTIRSCYLYTTRGRTHK